MDKSSNRISDTNKILTRLVQLCDDYINNARKFTEKPEEATKQNLIEPLLVLLGWNNTIDDDYYDREFRGKVKDIDWKDIALITSKKPKLFLESKDCTDTNIDRKYAPDLLRYLKNYNADKNEQEMVYWGILTNFTEFYFYHWSEKTSKPIPFFKFSYKEIIQKWPELTVLISPEAIKSDALTNRYLETPAHKLDDLFLDDLKKWRKIIANGFYKKNQGLTLDVLAEISNVFLNRLIFLRRLEAIGVLPPRWLKNQYELWKDGKTVPVATFMEYLRILFRNFWRFYDTELFEEQACDKYEFEDAYFQDLLKYIDTPTAEIREIMSIRELEDNGLYGYNFLELNLDILGAVYEKYLAHKLELKEIGKRQIVSIEETPELRQQEGAYFTPSHIVQLIVKHTLVPRLERIFSEASLFINDKRFKDAHNKIQEVGSIKVLDPATGSGSFLIVAFQIITSYYLRYNNLILSALRNASVEEQTRTAQFIVDKIGERVLLDNLYGVDLDAKAIEITKLNLWLQHIEINKTKYAYTGGPARRKLLPSLNRNIKVGNSLIKGDSQRILKENEKISKIVELRNRIAKVRILLSLNEVEEDVVRLQTEEQTLEKQIEELTQELDCYANEPLGQFGGGQEFNRFFNWQIQFPEVFENGGFDVYLGNPPYKNLYKYSKQFREYLELVDKEIFKSKNDILYHFYKRGIDLLKEKGSLGYITSRYFLEAENANLLRQFMSNRTIIDILIDYGNVELFKGINTRCVVLTLSKQSSLDSHNQIRAGKVKRWNGSHLELTQLLDLHLGKEFYSDNKLASTFTILQDELGTDSWRLLSPKEKHFRKRLEMNSWRLADVNGEEGICEIGMGMQTGKDEAFRVTSKEIIDERLEKTLIRRHVRNGDIRRYLVHPRDAYIIFTGGVKDIDEFPNVKRHLMKYYNDLMNRYPCKIDPPKKKWFEYTVLNMREAFEASEKIIVPYRAPNNRFALDIEKAIGAFDIYVIIPKKDSPVSINYVLAILNSSLIDYAYQIFYGRRKKAEFEYFTGLMQWLPIRKPPTDDLHDKLSSLSKAISSNQRERYNQIIRFEKKLNAVPEKITEVLKYYYDNAEYYGITNKEFLFEQSNTAKLTQYELHQIGVEEEKEEITIEGLISENAASPYRVRILRLTVQNKDVRRYLLYSIKLLIESSRSKKTMGKGKDLLSLILRSTKLYQLKLNRVDDLKSITSLMKEFEHDMGKDHQSISDIERDILTKSETIDDVVYKLYEVEDTDIELIHHLYRYNSVSEYFDRLEEYSGIEDIEIEEDEE